VYIASQQPQNVYEILFILLFHFSPHFLEFQAIEKTTSIFVLNHRVIKKGVNKQIKLFLLSKGGATH